MPRVIHNDGVTAIIEHEDGTRVRLAANDPLVELYSLPDANLQDVRQSGGRGSGMPGQMAPQQFTPERQAEILRRRDELLRARMALRQEGAVQPAPQQMPSAPTQMPSQDEIRRRRDELLRARAEQRQNEIRRRRDELLRARAAMRGTTLGMTDAVGRSSDADVRAVEAASKLPTSLQSTPREDAPQTPASKEKPVKLPRGISDRDYEALRAKIAEEILLGSY